ncbi:MAG: pyridoxal phosphate-dependent decarboxylase family protein [Bacillota bacterium]
MSTKHLSLPAQGLPKDELFRRMTEQRAGDFNWHDGRTWSLVYHAGDEITALIREAYAMFIHENGLGPLAFPSIRRMEAEVVSMSASLLGGDGEVVGNMTSGGSESILMAVKTARDRARAERPEVTAPEMLLPVTAHPAFDKAAHYFGLTPVKVPVTAGFRADLSALRDLITRNTVLMVGSSPSYPHGVIDPIAEMAALAAERSIHFHVDACVGGFLLPFARRLGHPVPAFDFTVPGVDSISADLHKYGYAAKGASVILFRNQQIRRHMFFATTDWPGGLYGSPTMTGTRPGGAIAAAWAVLNYLGEEGYLRLARTVLDTTRAIVEGIRATPGLRVLGEPDMSVLAFASDELDVFSLADALDQRGWHLDRQQRPNSLHLMVTPAHAGIVEPFLRDLRESTALLLGGGPAPEGSAAMYGALTSIPEREIVRDAIIGVMESWTQRSE